MLGGDEALPPPKVTITEISEVGNEEARLKEDNDIHDHNNNNNLLHPDQKRQQQQQQLQQQEQQLQPRLSLFGRPQKVRRSQIPTQLLQQPPLQPPKRTSSRYPALGDNNNNNTDTDVSKDVKANGNKDSKDSNNKNNSNNDQSDSFYSNFVDFRLSKYEAMKIHRDSISNSLVELKAKIAKDLDLDESTVTLAYIDTPYGPTVTITRDESLADALTKTKSFLVYGSPTSVLPSQQENQQEQRQQQSKPPPPPPAPPPPLPQQQQQQQLSVPKLLDLGGRSMSNDSSKTTNAKGFFKSLWGRSKSNINLRKSTVSDNSVVINRNSSGKMGDVELGGVGGDVGGVEVNKAVVAIGGGGKKAAFDRAGGAAVDVGGGMDQYQYGQPQNVQFINTTNVPMDITKTGGLLPTLNQNETHTRDQNVNAAVLPEPPKKSTLPPTTGTSGITPFIVKVNYEGTAYAIEVPKVSLEALGEQLRKQFGWTKEDVEAIHIMHDSMVLTSSLYLKSAMESWKRERKAMEFSVKRKEIPVRPLVLNNLTLYKGTGIGKEEVLGSVDSVVDESGGAANLEDLSDVMISYEWSSGKALAKKIKQELETRGLRVWFDEEKMRANMYERMAEAITQSTVITPILTAKYSVWTLFGNKSPNCKRELSYAADLRKHIEPTRALRDGEKLDPWVSLVTAGIIYYSFDNPEDPTKFQESMRNLYVSIREYLNAVAEAKKTEMAKEKNKGVEEVEDLSDDSEGDEDRDGYDALMALQAQAQIPGLAGPNPEPAQVFNVTVPMQYQMLPLSTPLDQKLGYFEGGAGGVGGKVGKDKALEGFVDAPKGYIAPVQAAPFDSGFGGEKKGLKGFFERFKNPRPPIAGGLIRKFQPTDQVSPQKGDLQQSTEGGSYPIDSSESAVSSASTVVDLSSGPSSTTSYWMPSTSESAVSSASTAVDLSNASSSSTSYWMPPTRGSATSSTSTLVDSSNLSSSARDHMMPPIRGSATSTASTVVVPSGPPVSAPPFMPKYEDQSSKAMPGKTFKSQAKKVDEEGVFISDGILDRGGCKEMAIRTTTTFEELKEWVTLDQWRRR
ncbi:hypothetical protein HDU76_005912 [Blyttiomyces sp. JEL0837]|nr:hypothetical protein HDU76_005912 [Blyttiomyces sp. JEL0837]